MHYKEYLKELEQRMSSGDFENSESEKFTKDESILYDLVWFMFDSGTYKGWLTVKDLTDEVTFADYEGFMEYLPKRSIRQSIRTLEKLVSLGILTIEEEDFWKDGNTQKIIRFTRKGASLPEKFMEDPETVTNRPSDR